MLLVTTRLGWIVLLLLLLLVQWLPLEPKHLLSCDEDKIRHSSDTINNRTKNVLGMERCGLSCHHQYVSPCKYRMGYFLTSMGLHLARSQLGVPILVGVCMAKADDSPALVHSRHI